MNEFHDVTGLLERWGSGDPDALNELVPSVYRELRGLAQYQLAGERKGHTLDPTALVNETYLRLGQSAQVRWHDRAHFFAVASRIMRRVLVDYARKRRAAKRGGGVTAITLLESRGPGKSQDIDVVALEEALTNLEKQDPRQCSVVEMRFFGGLKHHEIAEVLDVSLATVDRDWRVARLWLRRALAEDGNSA